MDILRMMNRIGSRPTMGFPRSIAGGSRQLGLALTCTFGLVWALTMCVAGGLMMLGSSGAAPWLATTLLAGGLTGVIAGVFVFQVVVASRLFPGAKSRLVRNAEALLGVALMIGVLLTTLTLLA